MQAVIFQRLAPNVGLAALLSATSNLESRIQRALSPNPQEGTDFPMSEDRTQPPSQRRRQMARDQGQAAHSPELSAAVGWLTAVVALGCCGQGLAVALAGLMRGVLSAADPSALPADVAGLASHLRGAAWSLLVPLGVILSAFAAGSLAAHQIQVRGLWTPGLVAPDLTRLWTPGRGSGAASRAGKTGWSMIKAVILVAVLAGSIRAGWGEVAGLGTLDGPDLASGAARTILRLSAVLAGTLVALGLLDFGLAWWRFEGLLQTTAEEQREDRRTLEGDVSARAQRRRIARAWRGDSPELMAGASLALFGSGGLTLILSGGPPPRRVMVRASARTSAGLRLRKSAEAARLASVEEPALADRLARVPATAPIPPELIADLAAIWPVRNSV